MPDLIIDLPNGYTLVTADTSQIPVPSLPPDFFRLHSLNPNPSRSASPVSLGATPSKEGVALLSSTPLKETLRIGGGLATPPTVVHLENGIPVDL